MEGLLDQCCVDPHCCVPQYAARDIGANFVLASGSAHHGFGSRAMEEFCIQLSQSGDELDASYPNSLASSASGYDNAALIAAATAGVATPVLRHGAYVNDSSSLAASSDTSSYDQSLGASTASTSDGYELAAAGSLAPLGVFDEPGYTLLFNAPAPSSSGGVWDADDDAATVDQTMGVWEPDRAIAVGSGSLVSAVLVEARADRQEDWSSRFYAAQTPQRGESVFGHLQRVLALPSAGPDQACRKWSLALQLVETQLARSGAPADFARASETDPILKWSNVLLGIKTRLRQQLNMVASSSGGSGSLESQIQHRLGGSATPDALVAARCILKHEVKRYARRSGCVVFVSCASAVG